MKVKKYTPKTIEAKWQKYWAAKNTFTAKDTGKKKFVLVEFPYPSGVGLHMGHLRPYVAADVYSRYFRLKGFEVLHPMGWDAFGLPAENFAIKHKMSPAVSVAKNIKSAKKQMLSWGLSYDWKREINTTDPSYYKWTQWIFLQLYKRGLAYEATGNINWCPKDKTGLANEEVIDGKCERCGTVVEKKKLRQWYLRITKYADKLLQGLQELPEWPSQVKLQQENWIGKSEGVIYSQKVKDLDIHLQAYDSVPQTFMAQTFAVIAPEHPLLETLVKGTKDEAKVLAFSEKIKQQKLANKFELDKSIEGIFTGRFLDNPFGTGDLPIWVASFVVADYGTGFVNSSAHDERDFAFAKKYNIPLRPVMFPKDPVEAKKIRDLEYCYHHADDAIMEKAPEHIIGMTWKEARRPIIDYIEKMGWGTRSTQYKMRDWVFTRQRYWGEPIPIIHCPKCGVVPVPEKDLPVKLPPVKNYEPTGTGESPLAAIKSWVNVKCPTCKGPAKRETNTMPQWAGSCWYWLRYTDHKNKKAFADKAKLKHWTPVDVYFGGYEHTTLHLLYSRFWNLVMYDAKLVPAKEPFKKRIPHGIILGPDGDKMSKSKGNVVDPQSIVSVHGADTLRMYELFLGPHGDQVAWNDKGVIGTKRFIDRVWYWINDLKDNKQFSSKDSTKVEIAINKLVKKIGEDIEEFRFNTCISALMSFMNDVKDEPVTKKTAIAFLTTLYPFAPHAVEELHAVLGGKGSMQKVAWPTFNPKKISTETVEIIIQVNGKVREKIQASKDATEAEIKEKAVGLEKVSAHITGDIKKVIYIPGRILNLVV